MSESRAEAADPAVSIVGWLDDELAHAGEDTEPVERRIGRLQARIAAGELTQDPDVEIPTGNDQWDDDETSR